MSFTPSLLDLPAKFAQYRPQQLSTALSIAAAQRRWSLLQASTGSGKSLLHQTISRLLGMRTLTLTPSRGLQRQYTGDFPYLALIEGSDNYRCRDTRRMGRRTCAADNGDSGSANCRYRKRMYDGEPVDAACPYLHAQQVARESNDVIGNIAYWLALAKHNPAAIGEYGLMVIDEAHNAMSWLTDACALEFTHHELHSIALDTPPVNGDITDWQLWSVVAVTVARAAYAHARDHQATPQRLAELTKLGLRLRELSDVATRAGEGEVSWVGEHMREGVALLPVWPGRYAEGKLWRGTPRVVLSSATLTREDARHLGLGVDDYTFHEVDAGFPANRHPLYYLPIARIDKNLGEGSWRLCMNEWDRFIGPRLRLGWRGVVQATSYEWAERFVRDCKYAGQCIAPKRGQDSRAAIAQFARGDGPPILVSPAVDEGHDFAGDTCRWQIIIKVPHANTLSPVVRARCTSDKGYRYHLAGRSLEQRCGRPMRSHTDWCENLIVDSHMGYMRGKPVFTKSFRATWHEVDRVPSPLEV